MANDVITVLSNDHAVVDARLEGALTGGDKGRAEAISDIIRELSMHAVAEEVVLYPAIRKALPDGDQLADDALAEHQRIEEALAELDGKSPEDDDVMATLTTFAGEFRHHVREEEDELFPKLRAAMDAEELEALGSKIETTKKTAPTHPHPHAPNTPPGNIIVGPPTGLLDRLRDALSS